MSIEIDIAPRYRSLVSARRLRQAVDMVLQQANADGDVTLVITDDETIAELNERFLGHSGATDVLSFPALSDDADAFATPPNAEPYLGDIVIAYPYAARQAKRLGRSVADELDLLAVHGALHLLGYDHVDPEEKAQMWAKQEAILAHLSCKAHHEAQE
ncbi:MAG: rRNA maturation RNase YbeY [Chloroflexi bacterium]|nr:rRNA maturation RNase YbeY [Chloroflexota bacterium]